MEQQQSFKKSRLSSFKEQHTDKIILNYGIEIEAVFELINEHIAYNQFINYYLHNEERSFDTIKSLVKILNTCINKPIADIEDIQDKINILKRNNIYITLTSDEPHSKVIDAYLSTNLNKLISADKKRLKLNNPHISDETKQIITEWSEFLNIGIQIIKYMLYKCDSEYNILDVMSTLLNINFELLNTVFISFSNVFDLTSNRKIKLYDITTEIDNFYKATPQDDEIFLCLTEDLSVICNNNLYTNISSGKFVKYYKLLNKCEFITQPFKTIDDVIRKVNIFFDDPIIKDTLLNCDATSQHVHISFNNSSGIIKPDIHLVLSIVCVCYHFQNELFTLFLDTRSNNKFCQKLNYHDSHMSFIYNIHDDYDRTIYNISSIFYKKHDTTENYYYNKFYWLNILNLYKFGPHDDKPYTIEFRIKQGSTDTEELGNVCKLYENIINYAIELLKDGTLKKITNIKDFKIAIEEIMNINKEDIYNEIILKGIKDYFTSSTSNYYIGLTKLNNYESDSESESELSGGRKQSSIRFSKSKLNIINSYIERLKKIPLYRKNSFGNEYIGHGLDDYTKTNLKTEFLDKTFIVKDLDNYLNSHNIKSSISGRLNSLKL